MNEQYYRIMLNDYAKPAFVTFDKAYYGSLQQVRTFIEALEQDMRAAILKLPILCASMRVAGIVACGTTPGGISV